MKHAFSFQIVGIIFLLVGLLIRYHIGKRKFNRRNFAGIEVFSTYGRGVFTRFFERLFRFLGMILILLAILLILFGNL